MDKPVRANDDKMPLAATIAIGGLALFGAITLAGWLLSALVGFIRFGIAVVVIFAVISWLAGRRADRRR
ncbi:hypothetical protein [Actinomarinicola tropica]|uniref:Uncharacterized protein n=1 Tax=Actinomarinicola tropica TaxID=2789776 RepID=A0A5Q2RNE1_9ACTN|nr:hypothetical protein [Actinomarinicola tropica]QGG96462.1 hypothetical protein GH723_15885 [Actinomarinicola tropica]